MSDVCSIKGGSWFNHSKHCRSAFHTHTSPSLRDHLVGFRLLFVRIKISNKFYLKGSSWNAPSKYCQSANRLLTDPNFQYHSYGFRLLFVRVKHD